MNRLLRILAIWFALMLWLACGLLLANDRQAGAFAAQACGMSQYIAFDRDGSSDSAAMLPFRGSWWFYHPKTGSVRTHFTTDKPMPVWCQAASMGLLGCSNLRLAKTGPCPTARLRNGCLPIAIAQARLHGGRVATRGQHAFRTQ